MSSRGRIYRDCSIVLQSPPNGLPTIVKLWCVWCREKTQVEGNYGFYEDKKAEWTLGETRPLYVERRPRCIRCFGCGREGRLVPIDPEIASISRNRLKDFARQFGYFGQAVKGFILDGRMPSSREPRSQVYEPTKDED
ncbi:uncharacterized protein K441DRAFT_192381 [Cenococcum geophilum 1.58]|uniref:uncharacterized protein n=1 Tax=Cenococcum geophilum 1.58 TaxID=794803 RepID=UPI00358F8061|nr:hypothetical protein K441DRAFT_192381 [Cenococcum geophilum 1.58]